MRAARRDVSRVPVNTRTFNRRSYSRQTHGRGCVSAEGGVCDLGCGEGGLASEPHQTEVDMAGGEVVLPGAILFLPRTFLPKIKNLRHSSD
ncbi:hypothetical protein HPP92_022563 [Vanilla planifolia]|uniref:Uncharacterized protein n=1 Tax=Vanilla planifolia TaxID=51239 RepID=A0A835PVM1_VANPL|nr:hypothetical protein HPP92_022821 [Vanilla planifolia]KAG0459435.1 hypothetical protein HPP92_022563 [Vanilla planifolia]